MLQSGPAMTTDHAGVFTPMVRVVVATSTLSGLRASRNVASIRRRRLRGNRCMEHLRAGAAGKTAIEE